MNRSLVRPELDLLRQRRLELGLTANPPPLQSLQRLVLPSAVLGIVLVGIVVFLQALALKREAALQRQLERWQPMELQMNQLKAGLKRTDERAKTLESTTAGIAARLVSIRSGSAFLEQLRRSTPEAVRLQSVEVQPTQVRLKGVAQGFGSRTGLHQINALMLNLEALPGVPEEGARLRLAEAEQGRLVSFNLDIQIDPAAKTTTDQLVDLGAIGLARRLLLLRQLGLSL